MFNIPENEAITKMKSLNLEEEVKIMTPQQRSAFGISTEYVLTMDMAKMLAMVSKTEVKAILK